MERFLEQREKISRKLNRLVNRLARKMEVSLCKKAKIDQTEDDSSALDTKIDELKDRIDVMKSNVDYLQDQIAECQTNIINLEELKVSLLFGINDIKQNSTFKFL
jgi:hypothetical protein